MPQSIPELSLTQGQVLWALGHGREPDRQLKDQVRYLRLLGIPGAVSENAAGPGKRIRYDFYDLVELGLGVTALRHRFKPGDISAVLHDDRTGMRMAFEHAWRELPEEALSADWVKSRGKMRPLMGDELYLRLHERRSEQWGKLDLVGPDQVREGLEIFAPIEMFEDGEIRVLMPLKALILPWVAWALDASPIRTGPK
jgi:hypothetical protein